MNSQLRQGTALIRISLALNVVLAIALVVQALYRPDRAATPSSNANADPIKTQNLAAAPALPPRVVRYTDFGSVQDGRRWLVDQLRAAGVPNNVLARFVQSDIETSWEKRFEDCHGDGDKLAAAQLEHDMGMDAEMRAALGEEGFRQWDQGNMLREAMLGSKMELTASEASAIYDAKKKLQQRQWELEQARANGTMDDAEITKEYQDAYSELTRQMKSAMGADRYDQAMRADDGSTALHQDLAKVNATDSQFEELLKAQQKLNEQRSALDKQFQENASSPDYAAQIKALDDARDREFQRVLGTNAFETLQKQQDGGYSKMKKYETTWGLDDNSIDYVYGTLSYYAKSAQDYQAQVRALEAQGHAVDWDAVGKNLQQFSDQTQQALRNYLGQDRFNRMQVNGVFPFDQQQPHH